MQVYKENDLTKEQYDQFKGYISFISALVSEQCAVGIDKNFVVFAANTHEIIFGKPRPNIKAAPVIVVMFKNLLRKIKEYEAKNYAVESEAKETTSASDSRKDDGKTHFRRGGRR